MPSMHQSLLSLRGKRVLSSKIGRRSGTVTKRWVKVEPRTLLYYKSFRAKKEAGSYVLDASVAIREPDRRKDTLLSDSRFAFCIDGLKEKNGRVRDDPIIIYSDSRESIDLWRRAVREACGAGNEKETEDKRTMKRREKSQEGAVVADSIKVFFGTSGYLLSQLSKDSEACADAIMLADRASDAQVRVVYNIMASDRMKLSSLRPLPENYVFGAVVLRALSEIGPIFPDEALVEWLRVFRAYSRSESTSKSKPIRSQQAMQVSTLLRLLPLKSMVLLEALFSFLYRSSTSSSVLTTLDTANLIKKYVVPKYPKGLGIDTKLWHKGMRRLLYLLLSNYDEIFVSSSESRNVSSTTRAPRLRPSLETTTTTKNTSTMREPEEIEYEIESKQKDKKKKVRFNEDDESLRGVELLSTASRTRQREEEEEEEKIDVPHSSSDDEEKKMETTRDRQSIEKIKKHIEDDDDTSSGMSDLDEQHVFFSDSDDGSDSDDETLRMMRKNVSIDLDSSYNEKNNKRVAAREKWRRDQEDRIKVGEQSRREQERIEMESRRQSEQEEEMKRREEEEKTRRREDERKRREEGERKRREEERKRREEDERKRREEEKERKRLAEEKKRHQDIEHENHARIRQAALAAKERSDRERRHLYQKSKRSSFNDISTIEFDFSKGRRNDKKKEEVVDSGEEELFDMVERERRQERRILEAKRRRDEAKHAQELAAAKRTQNNTTTTTTYEEDEEDEGMMSLLRERLEKRDRARAKVVSRIWERVRECNMLTSKARDSEIVHENRKTLRALMEEINTLQASTKPETSLQVMLKLLEENVNLSLNLYDYREDVVERTRIKQRQFLEQFNDSLSESPEVRSPSNSPPRPSRRNEKKDHTTTPPSSSALLSTLTSRLWQTHNKPLSQPKNEYDDDDDGAW